MADEQVFLSEGGMFVSISRVILAGTTYSTHNITSVSKRTRAPNGGCAILLIVIGVVISLGALVSFSASLEAGLVGLLFAAAILTAGVLWYRSLKPTHFVVFSSASGESEALTSQDEALVDRVVAAVNEAIVARG